MSRPGEKITRKSIQMQKKLKELDKKEIKSRSLLANVLDMEDAFHPASLPHSVHPSNTNKPILSNLCLTRYIYYIRVCQKTPTLDFSKKQISFPLHYISIDCI